MLGGELGAQAARPDRHRDGSQRTIAHGFFNGVSFDPEGGPLAQGKALGTSAFGFNLVEIAPGGQIPEHDEAQSGQVELYAILEGDAVLKIEGEEHPAPAGTFASIEPPATRTILNRSDAPVTALLIGVDPEGGYEPMGWA